MAKIWLEKKDRSGRGRDVKVALNEGRAVALEYDGYVRIDEPKAPKPTPTPPAS